MATNVWIRVAGVMGASAVAMGAIGAHAISKSPDNMKDVWKVTDKVLRHINDNIRFILKFVDGITVPSYSFCCSRNGRFEF